MALERAQSTLGRSVARLDSWAGAFYERPCDG
jgi:hypothetical protein